MLIYNNYKLYVFYKILLYYFSETTEIFVFITKFFVSLIGFSFKSGLINM